MDTLREVPTRSSAEWWTLVEGAFEAVCAAYNRRQFAPLLEADVAGYTYHAIVSRLDGDASRLHLDTRVLGASGNEKYDVVLGVCVDSGKRRRLALDNAPGDLPPYVRRFLMSKAALSEFRPAVRPEIVLEFKAFVTGFTPPQLREHLVQVLKDVPKLSALRATCADGRGLVLFDEAGYITGGREASIVAARADDKDLRIHIFEGAGSGEMKWRRIA
jgi:hypothetical protein